jgi:haloalkane dehalogenase
MPPALDVATQTQFVPPASPAWIDRAAYPFAHRSLELNAGHRIHYVDEGAGDTILFVHGTPTWSFEWRHLIGALAPSHRCIALDHLGFGLSDRPHNASYTPEAHARRLDEFVAKLGLRDITLVVHDFGGPIGLPLALETPGRVRRLVVINSWMWSFTGDRNMKRASRIAGGALGRFLYRWLNVSLRVITPSAYADRRKLTREIHAQYLAPFRDRWARGAVLWPLAHALLGSSAHYDRLWTLRDRLAAIPTAIIWGMRDPAFKPYMLDRWITAARNARVTRLDAGHWPHEEEPEAVIAAIREFVGC